ncbi:MAG TPA: hypothetical protein VMR23_14150 [Candidatus Limnocylindria bacterium]|nr:hypothetical protein [Candidatus Limnocylindria bacterium]
MNFYCSVEHIHRWLPTQPRPGRTYTLHEVAEAGPTLWGNMR